jgi:molybdopterin-guanine dinucleotide biosynthesis protein A
MVALLAHAGTSRSLALACDMPYVTRGLVERLAGHPGSAPVLAPRHDGKWDPLFARYDSRRVLGPARARLLGPWLSLQRLLDDVGAEELPLDPQERAMLRDWDRPEDVS